MSNRPRLRGSRRQPTEEDRYMAVLSGYDGRSAVFRYDADELERMIVRDACLGLENDPVRGEPFLWWAYQGYLRIARLRRVNPDTVFEGVQARIMAETGRAWP